jgi:hypothetical protein
VRVWHPGGGVQGNVLGIFQASQVARNRLYESSNAVIQPLNAVSKRVEYDGAKQ